MSVMIRRASLALMGLLVPLGLGCRLTLSSGSVVPPKKPVQWILVERPVSDLEGFFDKPDRLTSSSTLLTFEPVYDYEPAPTEISASTPVIDARPFMPLGVELLSLTPRKNARPGQVVTAVVRVADAHPEGLYQVTVTPSQEGVRVIGSNSHRIEGADTATFQFTRSTIGSGGISIGLKQIR